MMICRLRFVVQVLSFSWLRTLTISTSFLQMVPKYMSCIYVAYISTVYFDFVTQKLFLDALYVGWLFVYASC